MNSKTFSATFSQMNFLSIKILFVGYNLLSFDFKGMAGMYLG